MTIWPTTFTGRVFVTSIPLIAGLTDGVAATGTVLTVSLAGHMPTSGIQWLQNGVPIAGAVFETLIVPNGPGNVLAVEVDGTRSADVTIVDTRVVDFTFTGTVLNPGDVITLTVDGATALAGEVELTRSGQPVPVSNGQYSVSAADIAESFVARQANLPSNQSQARVVTATPLPVLVTGPDTSGGTQEGQTRTIDMTDSWAADGAPAAIVLREYRLLIGGVPQAAQASPVLSIPQGSAGQIGQAQIRARTATSAFSAWQMAGGAFAIETGSAWVISDNADGTFSITSTPEQLSAPTITDNGDGTFDIAA